jgi:hypothetical protein
MNITINLDILYHSIVIAGYVSICMQLYCILIFAVFHYMFLPTWHKQQIIIPHILRTPQMENMQNVTTWKKRQQTKKAAKHNPLSI